LNDMVDHFCAIEIFNFVSFSADSLVMDFVQVSEEEGDEPIELPAEEDGTLLVSTLQAQFPGSCGLKYRNLDTKAVRGVRSNEGRLFPPSVDAGWGEYLYFCVFPKDMTWSLQLKEAPKFIL